MTDREAMELGSDNSTRPKVPDRIMEQALVEAVRMATAEVRRAQSILRHLGLDTEPSNADDHGPTCADTPVDHRCGDTEADQGGTWQEVTTLHSERNRRISGMHVKVQGDAGMTDGTCAECGHLWPCPTYHVAAGWGLDSFYDCEEAGWCSHAGVKMA